VPEAKFQEVALYFTQAIGSRNFISWKQVNSHFVWEFSSAWKSISQCKLFETVL